VAKARVSRRPHGSKSRSPKAHGQKRRSEKSRGQKARSPRVRLPRPAPAELLLLELAKELVELTRDAEPARALSLPLQKLAAAYGPSESLPHEVFRAWVRSRNDKTAALALSWAREQVRLGLQEIVERARGARSRVELDSETFAWLLLAACEAIAQEPPSAVPDRVRALTQLIGHARAAG
jgi:hypothetical protein